MAKESLLTAVEKKMKNNSNYLADMASFDTERKISKSVVSVNEAVF